MMGFVAGLATGCLVGVLGTVLLLILTVGFSEERSQAVKSLPFRGLISGTVALFLAFGISHILHLHKSAEVLLLLLTILLIARLEGITSGLVASLAAAALICFFVLQPTGSFRVTRPNDRFVMALFLSVAMIGCRAVGAGNKKALLSGRS